MASIRYFLTMSRHQVFCHVLIAKDVIVGLTLLGLRNIHGYITVLNLMVYFAGHVLFFCVETKEGQRVTGKQALLLTLIGLKLVIS